MGTVGIESMCGYVGRKHQIPEEQIHHWRDFADLLRLPGGQYYNRHSVEHLVTAESGKPDYSTALWWYALREQGGVVQINPKATSFNARNLSSPLWKDAIQTRRAVLFASEIGESNGAKRYLMRSNTVFPLGCIYKDWVFYGSAARSFALITRDPHPAFAQYHPKSMPLFLPSDPEFLTHWLDPSVTQSAAISEVLDAPKLRVSFDVTPVKTYKRGETLGASQKLMAEF